MSAAPGAFSMHRSSSGSGSVCLPGALRDTRAPASESSSRWRSCLGTLCRALCSRAEEDFDCQPPSSPSSAPSPAHGAALGRSDAAGSASVQQLVALEEFLRCVEPADARDARAGGSGSGRTPADVRAQAAQAGGRAGEADPPVPDRGSDPEAPAAAGAPAPRGAVGAGEAREDKDAASPCCVYLETLDARSDDLNSVHMDADRMDSEESTTADSAGNQQELDEEEEEEEGCCICLDPLSAESAYAETAGAKEASDAALHTLKLECCGKSMHTECAKQLQNGDCPLCRSAHVPALCRLRLPAIIKSLYETVVDGEQAALIITLPEAFREIALPLQHLVLETRERQCITFLNDFNDLQAACGRGEGEVHAELLTRAAGAAARLEENQRTTRRYSADVLLPEPYTRSTLPGGRRSRFALGLRGAFNQEQERRRSAADDTATA